MYPYHVPFRFMISPLNPSVIRFVRGKPRLMEKELPRILFLEDRSGAEQRLLSSKIRQEPLTNSRQHQLETEVKMLPDLCKLLDSVHTARDFLLELDTGGESTKDLPAFLVCIACVANDRNVHCLLHQGKLRLHQGEVLQPGGAGGPLRGLQLGHVDALIDFLLFVRAKRMIKNRQNVFQVRKSDV